MAIFNSYVSLPEGKQLWTRKFWDLRVISSFSGQIGIKYCTLGLPNGLTHIQAYPSCFFKSMIGIWIEINYGGNVSLW